MLRFSYFLLLLFAIQYLVGQVPTTKLIVPETGSPMQKWQARSNIEGEDGATSIVQLPNGSLAIVGYVIPKGRKDRDGLILFMSQSGEVQDKVVFGEKNRNEWFTDIIFTQDEQLALIGVRENKNNQDIWMMKVSTNGRQQWENTIGNNSYHDEASSLIELADSSLAICGYSNQKGFNNWLGIVDGQKGELIHEDFLVADYEGKVSDITMDKSGNLWLVGFIHDPAQGESSCIIRYELDSHTHEWFKSTEENKIEQLTATVFTNSYQIAVVGNKVSRQRKDSDGWIRFMYEDGKTLVENTFGVPNSEEYFYDVAERQKRGGFILTGTTQQPNQKDHLWVVGTSEKGELLWEMNWEKTESQGNKIIATEGDSYVIAGSLGKEKNKDIWVVNIKMAPPPPPPALISWRIPHEFVIQEEKKLDQTTLNIRVEARSSVPLKNEHFFVYKNGKIIKGEKFKNGSLRKRTSQTYEFNKSLYLGQGKHRIEVGALIGNDTIFSPVGLVNVQKQASNLHILTIGAQFDDLKYSELDAKDIANAYLKNGTKNDLFQEIHVNTLIGDDASTTKIKSTIEGYEFQYQIGNIHKQDLLIIFISSHGVNPNARKSLKDMPRIKATDFKAGSEKSTTISLKADILELLAPVECKKLIILDACFSGYQGAKGSVMIDSAMKLLMDGETSTSILASSRADQVSYEHEQWENGAFTEVILEVFQNPKLVKKEPNDILTLGELYVYLQSKVPTLTLEALGEIQQPTLSKHANHDLPIFVFK